MRIMVVGGRGQVGTAVAMTELPLGMSAVQLGSDDLDITSSESIDDALNLVDPDVVINAAAATDVDALELDHARAWAINCHGAAALAAACAMKQVPLIHLSTDYVFSGPAPQVGQAWSVLDTKRPASVYGKSKSDGEDAVLTAHGQAWVVRTAWVYTGPNRLARGLPGSDFVTTMLQLEQSQDFVSVVRDQVGNPTQADALARGLIELADKVVAEPQCDLPAFRRILHCVGGGQASWYELAREIFTLAGADPSRVRGCSTSGFPRPAPRPQWSVLSDHAWRALGLAPLPHWKASLREEVAGVGRTASKEQKF